MLAHVQYIPNLKEALHNVLLFRIENAKGGVVLRWCGDGVCDRHTIISDIPSKPRCTLHNTECAIFAANIVWCVSYTVNNFTSG
jgi:hypothetical protein